MSTAIVLLTAALPFAWATGYWVGHGIAREQTRMDTLALIRLLDVYAREVTGGTLRWGPLRHHLAIMAGLETEQENQHGV